MQLLHRTLNLTAVSLCLPALLLLAACATKPAPVYSPVPSQTSVPSAPTRIILPVAAKPAPITQRRTVICANDKAHVRVEGAPDVYLVAYRQERLEQEIQERLDAKRALNTSSLDNHEYEVLVTVTSLKNGSALGQLLSGKAGEIEINSIVRIIDPAAGRQLSEFGIRQHIADTGFIGSSTSIREAESAFADGVATALTGQVSILPVTRELSQR